MEERKTGAADALVYFLTGLCDVLIINGGSAFDKLALIPRKCSKRIGSKECCLILIFSKLKFDAGCLLLIRSLMK